MDVMIGKVAPKAGRKVDQRNGDFAFYFFLICFCAFVLKGVCSFHFFLVAILKALYLPTVIYDGSSISFFLLKCLVLCDD